MINGTRHLAAVVAIAAYAATTPSHAAQINVGPTRTYKTLADGVAAAQANDTVILDQGTYVDQVASITVPIKIVGGGQGAVLEITQPISNHKGILIGDANLSVSNITFSGAQVTVADGNNGAGIRMEMGNLTVNNCKFNNNQDGILANPDATGSVTITNSRFNGNGAGDGYSHAIYINAVALLTVANSNFAGTKVGHDIKSRAMRTVVKNTILDDGISGTTSYAVDLPNGGIARLEGLKINQGPNTSNPTMISYGEEGNLHPSGSLSIANSVFTNTYHGVSYGIRNTTSVVAHLSGDTFTDVTIPLNGPGQITAGK